MRILIIILLFISTTAKAQPIKYWTALFNTVSGVSPAPRFNILWTALMENPAPFSPFFPLDAASCCAYSIGLGDTAYDGLHSLRALLFKTDPLVGAGTRAEVTPLYLDPGPYTERWVGFVVYLANYATDVAPDIIHQVHANNGESPPWAIGTLNGNWMVEINYDSLGVVRYHTIDLGIPYERNQWVKFVYHVRFAADNTGFVTLWKNDVIVFDYQNRITQYTTNPPFGATGGNFYRFGIYKWPYGQGLPTNTTQRLAYWDDMRIGSQLATYLDVVPDPTRP